MFGCTDLFVLSNSLTVHVVPSHIGKGGWYIVKHICPSDGDRKLILLMALIYMLCMCHCMCVLWFVCHYVRVEARLMTVVYVCVDTRLAAAVLHRLWLQVCATGRSHTHSPETANSHSI